MKSVGRKDKVTPVKTSGDFNVRKVNDADADFKVQKCPVGKPNTRSAAKKLLDIKNETRSKKDLSAKLETTIDFKQIEENDTGVVDKKQTKLNRKQLVNPQVWSVSEASSTSGDKEHISDSDDDVGQLINTKSVVKSDKNALPGTSNKKGKTPLKKVRGPTKSTGTKTTKSTEKKTKKCPVNKRLPTILRGLLGEASMRFANDETEDAIKICKEVVRLDPNYPEPYRTLSGFYSVLGDYGKSFELAVVAAQLAFPQDAKEWSALAEESLERDDEVTAAKCYAKAVLADPQNEKLHKRRLDLLTAMGDEKQFIKAKVSMLRNCAATDEDTMIERVDEAYSFATKCYHAGRVNSARLALTYALKRCSEHFETRHFSLLIKTQLLSNRFQDVSKIACKHFGVTFDDGDSAEVKLKNAITLNVKEEVPVEIQSTLCSTLIHCDKIELAKPLITRFIESEVEDQVYLDVAEALITKKHHELALTLFEKLINNSSPSMAADTWLNYAKCLVATNKGEDAITILTHAIQLCVDNKELHIFRTDLLASSGRHLEALDSLKQTQLQTDLVDSDVLFRRCCLLLRGERFEEFIKDVLTLLTKKDGTVMKVDILSALGLRPKQIEKANSDEESEFGTIKAVQLYRLLRIAVDFLFKHGRLAELKRFATLALATPFFRKNRQVYAEIKFLFAQVYFDVEDGDLSSILARYVLSLCVKLNTNRAWNFYCWVTAQDKTVVCGRFLDWLYKKEPNHYFFSLCYGHRALAFGRYRIALGEYEKALQTESGNPLLLLLSAVATLQYICQNINRPNPNIHSQLMQTCNFLYHYLIVRGESQEVYYNAGRSMHQIGLLETALSFYKRALDCKPSIDSPIYDMSREIAFNISLIYRTDKFYSSDTAQFYLDKYITI